MQTNTSNKCNINKRKYILWIYNTLFFSSVIIIFIFLFDNLNLIKSLQNINALSSPMENIQYDKIGINIDFVDSNDFLELVNNDYSINEDSSKYEIVSAFKVVAILTSDLVLNQKVLNETKKLFTDAKSLGFNDFFISSGYRTFEKQTELYENASDKTFVQKPNHSEHQTGLALDIAYKGTNISQMDEIKEGKWLMKNAWKYGLILRYPDGKSDITKISYEPWHYRYIGLPHAYYCYKNNLCLEEYIEFLKETDGYSIEIDGIKYLVFYEMPKNDIIQVPKDLNYEISSDNTGGYIITVKEN